MTDEQLNAIMMKADNDLERLKDRCHDLYDENVELKNRIDTAIEYIKDKARNNCWIDQYEASHLIGILQGSDKE